MGPLTYNLIQLNNLSTRQKAIMFGGKNIKGAVLCTVKGTPIFIDKNSIVNTSGYGIGDQFYISMPDSLNGIKSGNNELYYFISVIRDSDIWYIGFLFLEGARYKLRGFVSNSFDNTCLRLDTVRCHLQLLLGRGIHQNDSLVFTKYDISLDGHVQKMKLDSVVRNVFE